MKSISDGLLCNALAIFRFVTGVVGRPRSILTIVPKHTPAFVAMSMILNPFSKRSSFNVLISITESIIRHYEKSIVLGSTSRALASLRIVTKLGFCFSNSSRAIVAYATPDNLAKSRWLRTAFSLSSFNFIALLLYHLTFIITMVLTNMLSKCYYFASI